VKWVVFLLSFLLSFLKLFGCVIVIGGLGCFFLCVVIFAYNSIIAEVGGFWLFFFVKMRPPWWLGAHCVIGRNSNSSCHPFFRRRSGRCRVVWRMIFRVFLLLLLLLRILFCRCVRRGR